MGSGQSKLKVLDLSNKSLQKNMSIQPTSYVQPFRQFQSQYHKRSSNTLQQSIIKIKAPQQQLVISLNQQKFRQIQQAYQQKTKNFQIQAIIFDDYYTDRFTYIVRDLDFIKMILIRQFQNYQSHLFANIACEVHINQEITKLNVPYLLQMNENYIIQNQDIKFQNPNTQVMQFQPVSANLSQIIKYRRQNNWEWAQAQFDQLVYDLATGVNALHNNNITHNDLRPENIFYSSAKKCYKIGIFSYATKNATRGNLRSNRASINYMAPEVNSKETYDLKKADVFSLGNTLLCALFLCNPINIQQGNKNLSRLNRTKGIQAVTQMLRIENLRKPIQNILNSLQNHHYENKSMQNLIKSLRYKINPKNKNIQKYKTASSQFYKRLGLWQDWRNQVDQIMQTDNNLNNYQQAQMYKQLALINYCQDQLDESTSNAKRAAKLYREMGQDAFNEGNYNLALKQFKSAVQCSSYYVNKYDLDLAKSLICLSKVHAQKRQEKYSITLLTQAKQLVIKQSSHQSILYSQMMIKQAQLEKKFFRYEQSLEDLKEAYKIARKMQSINQKSSRLCQSKIQTLMAQNLIQISKKCDQDQKLQNLQKAEEHLNSSKNIYESLTDLDCHLELAQNTQVLGLYNVQKNQYAQAKLCFEKSIQMRRWYQQNKHQPNYIAAHGNTLSNLGRCQRLMNESKSNETYKQALKHQEQALDIFKGVYGSDHNFYSASILKQMGQLYQEMGQLNQSRDCFQCSRQILFQLYGQNSPYDQIGTFQKMLRN